MTDIDRTSAQADLAFLRELVDDGDWRRPARYFGATYLAIGLTILAQITVTDVLSFPGPAQLGAVVAVWVAYAVAQTFINANLNPGKIGASPRSRAEAMGFLSMVLSHLTLLVVFLITAINQQDGLFMKLAALSFFALQGGLWLMIHALRRDRWQLAVALGWLAAALAGAPFLDTDVFGLVVAIVVLMLMVAPGLYMIHVARGGER